MMTSIGSVDTPALAALWRLARDGGGRVQRGALTLVGASQPAWLAMTRDGRLLAAVLIGDGVMVDGMRVPEGGRRASGRRGRR